MNKLNECYLKANTSIFRITTTPGPELGLFRLRGANPGAPIKNHQFILSDLPDDGHSLVVKVSYGGTHRFVIENSSNPATGAIFSYKHAGATRKKFKPGEILSPSETHLLIWETKNAEGVKVTVTLTLIPLFDRHGLQVHYSLAPLK